MKKNHAYPPQITSTKEARKLLRKIGNTVLALADEGLLPSIFECTAGGMGDDDHFSHECSVTLRYKRKLIYVTAQIGKRTGEGARCSVYACDDLPAEQLLFPGLAAHMAAHPCSAYPDSTEGNRSDYYCYKEIPASQLAGAHIAILMAVQEYMCME